MFKFLAEGVMVEMVLSIESKCAVFADQVEIQVEWQPSGNNERGVCKLVFTRVLLLTENSDISF
jgi:hypothetical protein